MPDRIEREIEEILRKLDGVAPGQGGRANRRVGQPFTALQNWLTHRLARISLHQVMMWSLFTVVVSFFLMRAMPEAAWIMAFALIVFGTSFLLSRRSGAAGPQGEKRWRGQPLDLSGPGWPDRLKAWLKGRR